MTIFKMQNLFPVIIPILFFQELKADFVNITEQKKIASPSQLENNFGTTPAEVAITTAITVEDEKFDDNELRKLFVQKFKLYENAEKGKNKNDTREKQQRKSRYAVNATNYKRMECLSCQANGVSTADENCYKGFRIPSQNCSDAEQCYTELHPLYIKRGCILRGSLNRTFVCKCPFCNDKPSYDSTYYEYTKVSDWEYDNERLQKPVIGIDLICKVCETKGANKHADNVCKTGQNADYMVCGHDELCYVNINEQIDSVSRGCISKPAYNSYYHFCNNFKCNNIAFKNPKLRKPRELLTGLIPLSSRQKSHSHVPKMWPLLIIAPKILLYANV